MHVQRVALIAIVERQDRRRLAVGQRRGDLARRDWTCVQHYADAKTAVVEELIRRAQR